MIRQDVNFHNVQNLRVRVSEYAVSISTDCGLDLDFFPANGDGYDLLQEIVQAALEGLAKAAKEKNE